MFGRTGGVASAPLVCLVRRDVVLAVIDTVTYLRHRDTSLIETSELSVGTRGVTAILFIGTVFAVVLVIALPRFEDAAAVVASKLVGRARMES